MPSAHLSGPGSGGAPGTPDAPEGTGEGLCPGRRVTRPMSLITWSQEPLEAAFESMVLDASSGPPRSEGKCLELQVESTIDSAPTNHRSCAFQPSVDSTGDSSSGVGADFVLYR